MIPYESLWLSTLVLVGLYGTSMGLNGLSVSLWVLIDLNGCLGLFMGLYGF